MFAMCGATRAVRESGTCSMEDIITVRNPCSTAKIGPSYRPIVADAIAVYTEIVGNLIREIRLMGSVARGDAVTPFSDIDFIALLAEQPTEEQVAAVAGKAAELSQRFACVSKVDLETVVLERLSEARRFILSSDSVHLWGTDLYTLREQRISRQKLADMLTPDLAGIVTRRQEAVRGVPEGDEAMLMQWSRWSGKDVLKCLRETALLAGGTYERTIAGIHRQLRVHMSDQIELLDALYELYARPEPDRERILAVLGLAEAQLLNPPGTRRPSGHMLDANLRQATNADSEFAYQTKKAAFRTYVAAAGGWDEAEQRQLHRRRFAEQEFQVVQVSGEDVGVLVVARGLDCMKVNQLFILPEHQGRGIGEAIMKRVIEDAEGHGLPIRLRVLKANTRAASFYRRLGFVETGETDTHITMERSP
jgi:GNAT superfamily N-acetyltransferase/predicted nucleotidyltransferase